jgi:hypothetical protein
VLEVVDDFDGDTYRAVCTVRFAGVVYVPLCSMATSKIGEPTFLPMDREQVGSVRKLHGRSE